MKYPAEESTTVEFKEKVPKNNQIIKTIIGFCNQKGGKLIIGVDSNRSIIGISQEDVQGLMEYINKSIFEASCPPIIPLVYLQTIADKNLLIIEVSSGMNKPYYRKSEGLDKGTYIRLGRSTLLATSDMIEELKWQTRGRSFDMMSVYHASMEDLDKRKIQEFLGSRQVAKSNHITNEVLESYDLVVKEHSSIYPSIGGVLLFGKKPQKFLPEAFIICSKFSGVSGRNVISTIDCTGTLFEQFDMAYDFIISKLERSFSITGRKRTEQLELPEEAIREMLLNAIVHRNYHINAPTKIAIYENRLEIFSPGIFAGPIEVKDLTKGLTYIRNHVISKIFREAGYIEKLGSGFITLFSTYQNAGLSTPQVIEGENFIKCILPRKSFYSDQYDDLTDEQRILQLFELTHEISVSDVMKALNVSRATASRRVSELSANGVLKKSGFGKATRYLKNII